MTLPENRKPPAGTGGISEGDLLTCDLLNGTAELAAVADSAWRTLTAMLLSSPPTTFARGLLDQLPSTVPDPVLNWWLSGVGLAVDRGIVPNPLTASSAAITSGLVAPPGLRGLVVSAGWSLASESSVPFACAGDLLEIVRTAEVRQVAQRATRAMAAVVWTADLAELAEVFQSEAGAVLALVAEVTR